MAEYLLEIRDLHARVEGEVSDLFVGGYGSAHPGGGNFLFGDGSVHFLSETIDVPVYQQLGHRADGKLLQVRP